jgi:hypothetical protein
LWCLSKSQSVPGQFQLELSPIPKCVPCSLVYLIGLSSHLLHIVVCCYNLITYRKWSFFFWWTHKNLFVLGFVYSVVVIIFKIFGNIWWWQTVSNATSYLLTLSNLNFPMFRNKMVTLYYNKRSFSINIFFVVLYFAILIIVRNILGWYFVIFVPWTILYYVTISYRGFFEC